jgi:hypothetical protein
VAPNRRVKIIGGTAVAVVALGAGTALARSGTTSTEVDLDDIVPMSHVSAPATDPLHIAELNFQLDHQDSVASPFDTDDVDTTADESEPSIETADQSPLTADSPDDSPESPDDTDDSPESPDDTDDTPDSDD